MQTVQKRHGLPIITRSLRFLSIRLRTHPKTASLMPEINALRNQLREKDEIWAQALEERVAATALLGWHAHQLDKLVKSLSMAILASNGNDRDSVVYRTLFTVVPSEGLKPVAGDAKRRYVQQVLAALETVPDLSGFGDHIASIREAQGRLDQTNSVREALYTAEAIASGAKRRAMEEARNTYNLFQSRLNMLFPDQPAFVETFFLDIRHASKDITEQPATDLANVA